MKRLAACLLALVLLLSGCTEGSYVSVKPHQGEIPPAMPRRWQWVIMRKCWLP